MLFRSVAFSLCFAAIVNAPRVAFTQVRVVQGVVIDRASSDEIAGARVILTPLDARDTLARAVKYGAITRSDGQFRFSDLPVGRYRLVVRSVGFEADSEGLAIPVGLRSDTLHLRIALNALPMPSQDVVVSGTREERSLESVPVRVELVSQEEIEEKIMEKPSNVIELLNESVGTRIQNTSPASNAANIRIQGLDGRYTQILVDGIPSYSGLASSLGLTQLAPLNLRRVEIVKGASSAVYGPDAIAGLINFITKDPSEVPEFSAVLNGSDQKGYDASAYFGQQFDAFGLTTLVAYHKQQMVDIDGDGLSDIAASDRFTITPKFKYQINDKITGVATMSYLTETRQGGTMNAPDSAIGKVAPWVESDKTARFDLATSLVWKIDESRSVTFRAAGMHLDDNSFFGASPFAGVQDFRLADMQYEFPWSSHRLQIGGAFQSDRFQDKTPNVESRSYAYSDAGGWLQDDMGENAPWEMLFSARIDSHDPYGTFFTPRASLMYRPSGSLTLRLGAGTGFKAPTIFLEDAELYGYSNLRPLRSVVPEQAQSATFDVNYHAPIGAVAAHIDFALFTTNLDHALLLNDDSLASHILVVQNATGPTVSRGVECSADLSLDELRLVASYAYLDARQTDADRTYSLELNPRHWLGLTLSYEDEEDGFKAGIESYYIGEQRVQDDPFRSTTPSYWLCGALIEKAFGVVHLFLNGEDLFDVRQTRYEPVFLGDPLQGNIQPLHQWAPIEGRMINGGIRIVMH